MDFEAEPDYERIETILTLILEKNGLTDSLQLPHIPLKSEDNFKNPTSH
jgi:hypothetical protein